MTSELWVLGIGCLAFMLIGYQLHGTLLDRLCRDKEKQVRFWGISESVRRGENLDSAAKTIDELLRRFRYFMVMGEAIHDAHPESSDKEMFRKILDEGWEIYGKVCTREKEN